MNSVRGVQQKETNRGLEGSPKNRNAKIRQPGDLGQGVLGECGDSAPAKSGAWGAGKTMDTSVRTTLLTLDRMSLKTKNGSPWKAAETVLTVARARQMLGESLPAGTVAMALERRGYL